jgi:hypothetical protein
MRLVGVVIPLLWFGILFAAGALRPGYDHVRQYMTELTVGDNAWLAQLAFFVVGPLVLLFAFALMRAGAPPLGVALIAIKGSAIIVGGLFIGDVDLGVRTTSGLIHNLSVVIGNVAMAAGIVVVTLAWRRAVGFSMVSAAVIIIATALMAVATPQGTGSPTAPLAPWAGLLQRVSMLANFTWPVVVAFARPQVGSWIATTGRITREAS